MSESTAAVTTATAAPPQASTRWALERVLFLLAGTMTLLGAALAATVSPWWLLLVAFVAVNQWAYAVLGACPASLVLRRWFTPRCGRA